MELAGRTRASFGTGTRHGDVLDATLELADPPHGFAWQTPQIAGVELAPLHPGLQISLSGSQADRCELLAQWVPLGSATVQVLRSRTVTSGLSPGSDVHWRVTTPTGADLSESGRAEPSAAISDRGSSEPFVQFKRASSGNPNEDTLIRIALVYERTPGTVPARGWIRLEKVWLTD